MNLIADYLQLGANTLALAVAGWIYVAYVKNIRAGLTIKDEQIKVLERSLAFWKDKASDFEKKTPEYMEEILSKRIRQREEEIKRLNEDNEKHSKQVASKTRELARLRAELEKTAYLGKALTYYDPESDAEVAIPEAEVELEVLGEVFVDSASLLITDPMYVQGEWDSDEEYVDLRLYRHTASGKVYRFGEHFDHYEAEIPELGETANALLKRGGLVPLEVRREFTYSLPGAMYASSSEHGYGELKFANGNTGAGICVRTVYGDGVFTVFGERFKGDLVRIYIDLR